MSIEGTRTLPNATEGFRIVNERETNDFAFIHDANEIKYEISRFVLILVFAGGVWRLNRSSNAKFIHNDWNFRNCNYSAVGDIFAEQPYAVAVQQGSHLQVTWFTSKSQARDLKNFCLARRQGRTVSNDSRVAEGPLFRGTNSEILEHEQRLMHKKRRLGRHHARIARRCFHRDSGWFG